VQTKKTQNGKKPKRMSIVKGVKQRFSLNSEALRARAFIWFAIGLLVGMIAATFMM